MEMQLLVFHMTYNDDDDDGDFKIKGAFLQVAQVLIVLKCIHTLTFRLYDDEV